MIKRKLGRKVKYRKMMLRNLATSVILYEKVTTTYAKVQEVKRLVDKIINLGKKNNLDARRKLLAYLTDKNAVKKIFEVLIDKYKDRNSGYTTIYKLKSRLGDAASMTMIQLVNIDDKKIIEKNQTKLKKTL